jgi:hypothetical protein
MLDWFSGYIGYDASKMVLGNFLITSPDGEVRRCQDTWETARGSFESGVQVCRGSPTDQMLAASKEYGFICSDRAVLRVSGNPSKFLQGHNVAGPSVSQLGPVLQAMVRGFQDGFRPIDADDDRLPSVHRSRVDVTTAVDLDTHQAVHDWIKLAAAATRSRSGKAISSGSTVYWNSGSRRWQLKAYCKHCELLAHPPIVREMVPDLLEWSRSHLRIELTLKRPELQARGTLHESVIWEYLARLEIPTMRESVRVDNLDLQPSVKAALQLWADGHDLFCIYPTRTAYRYRRTILDQVGFDVTMSASEQIKADPDALLGLEELQRREVLTVPDKIQRSLFGAG